MKNKKIRIITNVLIGIIIISICLISFKDKGSVTISSTNGYKAYYNGSESSGGVALMFNVYENTQIVEEIMRVLVKNQASATFFVGGCWADDNEKTLKAIINSGFELGNHGYFHKDHNKISQSENKNEIANCHKIIRSLTGYNTVLFAPPSGSFSKVTLAVCAELNYKTIMWSKDTIDWRDSDKNLIIKRATNGVKSGDLILMHPKRHTLDALQSIIDEIKSKNLKLLTVSECCEFNA